MPGCCAPCCTNSRTNSNARFFRFPADPARRKLWTAQVKRADWIPTAGSYLCSEHFEPDSFEANRQDGWKKLKPNAVPTLFPYRPVPKRRKAPKDRSHAPLAATQKEPPSHNVQLDDTCCHDLPQGMDIQNAQKDASQAELKKQLDDITKKYMELQEHHQRAKSAIQHNKSKIQALEEQIQNIQEHRTLNRDQFEALSRNSMRGIKWSSDTVKDSLQIKFVCGTTGYELLRSKGYPLPSSRTLARRLQGLQFKPGILHEVFNVLQTKVEGMSACEKDCVLFVDEMEIMQGFEHDRSQDCVLGGITLPQKPQESANHALVVMLGGLNSRWKQVVGYHFTGKSIEGTVLRNFVFEIIEVCSSLSLNVLAVTSDMGSANRAMWQTLNLSSHRLSKTVCAIPHPYLPNRNLYFVPDPAHVLKNLRAQLLRSGKFYLSENTVKKNGLPGNVVNLEHICAVIDMDSNSELKVAPKLSDIHVSSGHFTKMKVGVAVQFFREAPPAIRHLISEGVLSHEAESTAWFLQLISQWYTLMSSRHPVSALSHLDVTKHKAALEKLNLASDTVQQMTMGSTAHWKPSQAGVIMSTKVVLELQDELLNKHNYKFLLTGRLTQDCLENLFSVIRLRKPMPSAYDLKCALKLVSISQFLHTPKTSSYELDDRSYLADLLSPDIKALRDEMEEASSEPEEMLVVEAVSSSECNILGHLSGFLIRCILVKVKGCAICKEELLGDSGGQYSKLISLKEYTKGSLTSPSENVIKTIIEFEEHLKALLSSNSVLSMDHPRKYLSKMLSFNVHPNVSTCTEHKSAVTKMLVEKYVSTRLKIHLKHLDVSRTAVYSSKTCAGVTLS